MEIRQSFPGGFLGGSAPCLREFRLSNIPFLALPTFLSSASGLLELRLYDVPPAGYISPEALLACMAVLPRLKYFAIEYQSPTPHPHRIHPPESPVVLLALFSIEFTGSSEYLEDLISHIDAPRLNQFLLRYFDQPDFQAPQLSEFIDLTNLKLFKSSHAEVALLFSMTWSPSGVFIPTPT